MRLLDLYCGAGGAAKGYHDAGFTEIVGVDHEEQKHYTYEFVQADALKYLADHGHGFDAIHASPPCQAYTIMRNLPWLAGRKYPALIKPTKDLLNYVGKPYVIENVMGARQGSKTLEKFGLQAHGLRANYLCGLMFDLPFYRHRLFYTNWYWQMPQHAKHWLPPRRGNFADRNPAVGSGGQSEDASNWYEEFDHIGPGATRQTMYIPTKSGNFDPAFERRPQTNDPDRQFDKRIAFAGYESAAEREHPNPVNTEWRKAHDGGGLNLREGYEDKALNFPTLVNGVEGKAAWKMAAEAMGIDWMNRDELTQAIPPSFTRYLGELLIGKIRRSA